MSGRDFAEIRVASEGGITTVTLDRPERHNALDVRMIGELRGVILAGNGACLTPLLDKVDLVAGSQPALNG